MAAADSFKCAGVWCLVFGIIFGLVSPSGPLWAFIAGCLIVCCGGSTEEDLKKQVGCAKCCAITGIILSLLCTIVFIVVGIVIATNVDQFCNLVSQGASAACALDVSMCFGADLILRQACDGVMVGGIIICIIPTVIHALLFFSFIYLLKTANAFAKEPSKDAPGGFQMGQA